MCTSLSRRFCTLRVTLRIEFQNNSGQNAAQFQALVDGWETAIEDMWNGPDGYQDYGCCCVRFNVVTRVGSGTAGYHQINVVAGPQTSVVNRRGPGCTSGRWDAMDTGNVAAHESGHLLGLADEYDYNGPGGGYQNLNPQPSDPQSIMAQTWGTVAALQSHISAIMGALDARCPWWCCILKWFYRLIVRRRIRVVEAVNIERTEVMTPAERENPLELSPERLLAVIDSGDPDAMALALDALIRQGERNIELLSRTLTSERPLLRWAAASALGEIGSERAVAPLATALDDANASVRIRAAHGLAKIGSTGGIPVLIGELTSDEILIGHPPVQVAEHAAQVLESIVGEKHGPDGDSAEARQARADQWQSWWRETGGNFTL